MEIVGQVIDGAPVSEVYMVDDPRSLKGIERSVNGREVYLGIEPLQLRGNIVGGQMTGSIDQRF